MSRFGISANTLSSDTNNALAQAGFGNTPPTAFRKGSGYTKGRSGVGDVQQIYPPGN